MWPFDNVSIEEAIERAAKAGAIRSYDNWVLEFRDKNLNNINISRWRTHIRIETAYRTLCRVLSPEDKIEIKDQIQYLLVEWIHHTIKDVTIERTGSVYRFGPYNGQCALWVRTEKKVGDVRIVHIDLEYQEIKLFLFKFLSVDENIIDTFKEHIWGISDVAF